MQKVENNNKTYSYERTHIWAADCDKAIDALKKLAKQKKLPFSTLIGNILKDYLANAK